MSTERCVACGVEIPEGRQVCPNCEITLNNEIFANYRNNETGVRCEASKPQKNSVQANVPQINVVPASEMHEKIRKEEMTPEYFGPYVFRGDVFFADLNPVVGCETGGIRPVVIIQNDIGNRYSPTIIAAITSRTTKKELPTHVRVNSETGGLMKDSVIMLEQMRTIDRARLKRRIGHIDNETLEKIDNAIKASLGIGIIDNTENAQNA